MIEFIHHDDMSNEDNNLKDLQDFFKKRNETVRTEKNDVLSIIAPFLEQLDNSKIPDQELKNKKRTTI